MTHEFDYVPDNLTIFPGFYESCLYYSDMECNHNYDEAMNFDNYMDEEIDDFATYKRDVCLEIAELIGEYLVDGEICKSVELSGISSPREYNFTTDKLELKLDIDIERIANKVWHETTMHMGFDKYLRKKYTSCSGFRSFVENNISDFLERWDYLDVLVDYWLLSKIFDDTDVADCISKGMETPYEYDMYDIASNVFMQHTRPIDEAEYIGNAMKGENIVEWCREKLGNHKDFFYTSDAERIIDMGLADEFYKTANILPYKEHDNVQ